MRFTWQGCWCLINQELLSRSHVACIYTHFSRINGWLGASDEPVVDWCMNLIGCLWWTELVATFSFRSLSGCLFCYIRQREQLWSRESSRKVIRGGGWCPCHQQLMLLTWSSEWVCVSRSYWMGTRSHLLPVYSPGCAPQGRLQEQKTWALPQCALMKVSL